MNFLKKFNKYQILSVLATGLFMTSCVYDNFDIDSSEDLESVKDTYALTLTLNLPVLDSRASSNDWDEDLENNVEDFVLLFFGNDDKLLRQYLSDNLSFFQVEEAKGYMKQWYVRIPMNQDSEDDKEFFQTLREKDFKIAVLANWPDYQALETLTDISMLHHLREDELATKYYQGIAKDGLMGARTEWVTNKFESKADANAKIRYVWDPSLSLNYSEDPSNTPKYNYGDYTDLWLLWNFGADATDNDLPYDDKYSDKWIERNGRMLYEWWNKGNNNDNSLSDLNIAEEDESVEPDETPENGNTRSDDIDNPEDPNPLRFKSAEGAKAVKTEYNGQFFYGVKLPKVKPANKEVSEKDGGVFSFLARGSGTLYITAKGTPTVSGTDLNSDNNDINELSYDISVPGDDKTICIYNNSDSELIIYQIEYVQDQYLFETDREGKSINEQLIPMYGIHKFGALKDVWKEGTVFDLSNFNQISTNYTSGKPIELLRSVAKVEVLLPSEMNPHHVLMRGMNRWAYAEPMDVATSTDVIWHDQNNSDSGSHLNDKCEWSKLRGVTPWYFGAKYDDRLENLKWYYGNWESINPKFELDEQNKIDGYPHILNPRIESSNFVRFHYSGRYDEYERYILYVPEKFVDDPANSEESGSDPVICHIEFRGEGDSFVNLDDNNCYRIYFTENGFYSGTDGDKDPPKLIDGDFWENSYEQSTENLKHHWTIMRNHVYSFTVSYNPNGYVAAVVKVLPWKRRVIDVEW